MSENGKAPPERGGHHSQRLEPEEAPDVVVDLRLVGEEDVRVTERSSRLGCVGHEVGAARDGDDVADPYPSRRGAVVREHHVHLRVPADAVPHLAVAELPVHLAREQFHPEFEAQLGDENAEEDIDVEGRDGEEVVLRMVRLLHRRVRHSRDARLQLSQGRENREVDPGLLQRRADFFHLFRRQTVRLAVHQRPEVPLPSASRFVRFPAMIFLPFA